jgi:hypothetical protein
VSKDCTSNSFSNSSTSGSSTIFDDMYHQCRASRLSGLKDNLVSICNDNTFGKRIVSQAAQIGTLADHEGIGVTFHGSRFLRGSSTVNQSISSSFDLSNLNCVSCKGEHSIIGEKPVTVCFSDQNFVATLSSDDANCMCIVRLENASLLELFDLAKEIFINTKLPEGSVLLFGCASYLGRCGTSVYAREWTTLVAGVSATWGGGARLPTDPAHRNRMPRLCNEGVVRALYMVQKHI